MMRFTNELGLPQPFVDAATRGRTFRLKRYSVTEVLAGPTMAVLKRRHAHEAVEDVSDRVWAIFGTAVHSILESGSETASQIKEGDLSVDMGGGYTLTGRFDLFDASTGTVTDYKTTSVWKFQVGDVEDWREQTMLYCWMLRENGFDAHRGEIVAIMRDHSMREARTKPDYPKHPVARIAFEFDDEKMKEAGELARSWFIEVARLEKLPDDKLPACSPVDRWHKDDTWAVKRDGKKRAVRVLKSEADASAYLSALGNRDKDGRYRVEFRPGEDTRCESYCPVSDWCAHTRGVDG